MVAKKVLEVGTASVDNIKTCIGVLKTAIKDGKDHKPVVAIYVKGSELCVGLYGNTESKKAVDLDEGSMVVGFTEHDYLRLAKSTEDVLKISKMVQVNAQIKAENKFPKLVDKGSEHILKGVTDFIEDGNKVNIVYDKGVAGYLKTPTVTTEEILTEIRNTLVKGKTIKGVQIMGIPKVTLYIKLKQTGQVEISFTYLGTKDNVYETIQWEGKASIKTIVYQKLQDSKVYDRGLKESHLNKSN